MSSLLLIPILIVSACAPPAPTEPGDDLAITSSATPALSVTPSPAGPTASGTLEPTGTPIPELPPLQARLAVLTAQARLTRGGASTDIQQAQSADILMHDLIEMVQNEGQSEKSYSLLQFPSLANVELLGATKLLLVDARQGTEETPAQTILNLTDGHLFVHLSEQELINLTVQTPFASIRALTIGAEFDVCHTEAMTCVMVKRGAVEIVAQDEREIVKAGSAGVVLDDESAPYVICAPIPAFLAWEERFRTTTNAPSLQQEIDALPGQACLMAANGFPFNARIFYRDEFSSQATGWPQAQTDQFTTAYTRVEGGRFYQVQIHDEDEQFIAFVPNGRDYQNANIDLQTRVQLAGRGDFRYGVIFRRTDEQYYAFLVSPVTQTWYFLKNSSTGSEVLKSGPAERLRGVEGQDTLRIESYGATFLLYINGRFLDSVSDSEYTSGVVGLFVESIDNVNARLNFNTLTIWDLLPAVTNRVPGENCFNGIDDDQDGFTDLADPTCQRPGAVITYPTVPPLPTITPRPTRTPRPTSTVGPTNTSGPTSTPRPTRTLRPTRTPTPEPTDTPRFTRTPRPTRSPTPEPTDTPQPTRTPRPTDPPPSNTPCGSYC